MTDSESSHPYTSNERAFPPAEMALISDARQSSGCELLSSFGRDLDDDIDAADARLHSRIERRDFFKNDLLRACHSDAECRAKIKRCAKQLRHTKAQDIREALIAAVDEALAGLDYTFKRRRDLLASRLGVSVATVNAQIKRGQRVLAIAVQKAKSVGQPDHCADEPAVVQTIRLKPNLLNATRGTQFDSEARRAAIATLTAEQQNEFVRLLDRQSTEGEIDAVEKDDRATRIKMLPHSFNRVLDDVGRSDDQSRRLLARMSPEERKALCADWMAETVDAAIGGSAEQRQAARDALNPREYSKMVRAFVERHKTQRAA